MTTEDVLDQYGRIIHQEAWTCLRALPPDGLYEQTDLFQEGVIVAIRALAKFDTTRRRPDGTPVKFLSYLGVSLRNRYRDILRAERVRARYRGMMPEQV